MMGVDTRAPVHLHASKSRNLNISSARQRNLQVKHRRDATFSQSAYHFSYYLQERKLTGRVSFKIAIIHVQAMVKH